MNKEWTNNGKTDLKSNWLFIKWSLKKIEIQWKWSIHNNLPCLVVWCMNRRTELKVVSPHVIRLFYIIWIGNQLQEAWCNWTLDFGPEFRANCILSFLNGSKPCPVFSPPRWLVELFNVVHHRLSAVSMRDTESSNNC